MWAQHTPCQRRMIFLQRGTASRHGHSATMTCMMTRHMLPTCQDWGASFTRCCPRLIHTVAARVSQDFPLRDSMCDLIATVPRVYASCAMELGFSCQNMSRQIVLVLSWRLADLAGQVCFVTTTAFGCAQGERVHHVCVCMFCRPMLQR